MRKPSLVYVQSFDSFRKLAVTGLKLGLLCGMVFLPPPQAHADGVVSSDFVFQLDNSVFATAAYDFKKIFNGSAKVQLPEMVIQDLVPVNVSGIEAELNYKFDTATDSPVLGAETAIVARDFSAVLNIGKVDVDAEITQVMNGVTAIAHVKGSCTNVKATLTAGKTRAMGSLAFLVGADGIPYLKVPWFHVAWDPDAWKVESAMTCVGARNFDIRVRKSLEEYLKNSAGFEPLLRSFIDKKIATYQAKIQDWFKTPISLALGLTRVKASVLPERLELLRGDKFQIRGRLDFAFESGVYKDRVELPERSSLPLQTSYALSLPSGFLSALNEMAYKSGYYVVRKMGNEIPAFKNFRESGVSVSVAWPELGWYPKEMDFVFDLVPSGLPSLSGIESDGRGGLVGSVGGILKTSVWAQKFRLPVEYGKFDSFTATTRGSFRLSIGDDPSGSQLLLGFTGLDLQVAHAWDPGYSAKNPGVATETIASSIRDSLVQEPTAFKLGTFAVGEGLRLKPLSLRKSGRWLLIDLSSTK